MLRRSIKVMALGATMLLVAAGTAFAEYSEEEDASGPAGGEDVTVTEDNGVVGEVDEDDVLTLEGDWEFTDGACLTLMDSDGTQGDFCDGENAEFELGSIILTITGAATGVSGGDGVLNTDGLTVLASDGVTAMSATGADSLPNTGGAFGVLAALLGGLTVIGGGLWYAGRRMGTSIR